MVATKRASAGLKKPIKSSLYNTLRPRAPKRDASAMRTTGQEQNPWYGEHDLHQRRRGTIACGQQSRLSCGLNSRGCSQIGFGTRGPIQNTRGMAVVALQKSLSRKSFVHWQLSTTS